MSPRRFFPPLSPGQQTIMDRLAAGGSLVRRPVAGHPYQLRGGGGGVRAVHAASVTGLVQRGFVAEFPVVGNAEHVAEYYLTDLGRSMLPRKDTR